MFDSIKFIIICCKVELSKDEIAFIEKQLLTMNREELIDLSLRHGVLPLVYKTLKSLFESHSLDETLVQSLLDELKTHYIRIAQRNMLMSAELIQIIKLLNTHTIDALAFKGPTLAQMAYGDITLRQYGDIDILIKDKDKARMLSLLIENGYIPEIALKEETIDTFLNAVNVIAFYKKSTGIRIEIHWELLSKNYAIHWHEPILWEKEEFIQINRINIPVLPVEQQLLYISAHSAKHLFERIEWICDIDRSVRSNPNMDWAYLLDEADKLGIRRMLLLGLSLSQDLFGLILPIEIKESIYKDKNIPILISKISAINFEASTQKEKNYSTFGLLWSMRENLSDKLRFSFSGLFAAKFDDFVFIQLPRNLAFMYPLVRPYRLIRKYLF